MKNRKQKQFCMLCTCSLSFLYNLLPLSSFWQYEMTCLPLCGQCEVLLKVFNGKMIFYWIYCSLWMDGVFPLVMDRETTAQEKCFQILDEVLLSNIEPQSKLVKWEKDKLPQKVSLCCPWFSSFLFITNCILEYSAFRIFAFCYKSMISNNK